MRADMTVGRRLARGARSEVNDRAVRQVGFIHSSGRDAATARLFVSLMTRQYRAREGITDDGRDREEGPGEDLCLLAHEGAADHREAGDWAGDRAARRAAH